jgi:hypothetical protein
VFRHEMLPVAVAGTSSSGTSSILLVGSAVTLVVCHDSTVQVGAKA